MSAPTPLRTELLQLMSDGAATRLPDDRFDRLARRVFAQNAAAVPAYGAFCKARGRTPETVASWTEIPAVPTAAFKELPLHDEAAGVERVFRTSGTSRGPERRGAHHVADLDLYRASLLSTFEAFLLADGARPRILSLMPPAGALPDSSLAFMIDEVMAAFRRSGDGAGAVFADADGLDVGALDDAVDAAVAADAPVLLLGTSAAFIHWLDHMADAGRSVRLPDGSRLMDTGGFKGAGRRLDPAELRGAYAQRLGLPPVAAVNEYGMTELLSQYYDAALRDRHAGARPPARKRGPAWLRSVAVDPETLEALPAGKRGLLRHVDLANLFSVAAVQTEDVGRVDEHGLVLDGRAPGAPPRGCSIAMDMLLEAAR